MSPPWTFTIALLVNPERVGRKTCDSMSARAAYAAAACPAFPAEASAMSVAPCWAAAVTAIVWPRSLNVPVGFRPSSLNRTRSTPISSARFGQLHERGRALVHRHRRFAGEREQFRVLPHRLERSGFEVRTRHVDLVVVVVRVEDAVAVGTAVCPHLGVERLAAVYARQADECVRRLHARWWVGGTLSPVHPPPLLPPALQLSDMQPDEVQSVLADRVEALRKSLAERWGDAPHRVRPTMDVPEYDAPTTPDDIFPWVAVCFVVEDGRVLLVQDSGHSPEWEPPGGKGEVRYAPRRKRAVDHREAAGEGQRRRIGRRNRRAGNPRGDRNRVRGDRPAVHRNAPLRLRKRRADVGVAGGIRRPSGRRRDSPDCGGHRERLVVRTGGDTGRNAVRGEDPFVESSNGSASITPTRSAEKRLGRTTDQFV